MTLDELPARPQSAAVLHQDAQSPSWAYDVKRGNNEDGLVLQSRDTAAASSEFGLRQVNSQAYIGTITYVIIWLKHMLTPKS